MKYSDNPFVITGVHRFVSADTTPIESTAVHFLDYYVNGVARVSTINLISNYAVGFYVDTSVVEQMKVITYSQELLGGSRRLTTREQDVLYYTLLRSIKTKPSRKNR